ncbi:hypothetical protein ACFY3M_17020 [Streptomyces mirabilis]|uniref:hypothetical protein n=1 Tax=Streptomyces mirabilis TaxID=68239 RepID=UPI0036C4DC03
MYALPWPEVGPSGSWFRISARIVEIAYRQYDERRSTKKEPGRDAYVCHVLDGLRVGR